MLNKLLSQVKSRIGSPHIDLLLDKDEFTPGEKVTGAFLIKNGLFEQKIKRLECDLFTESAAAKPLNTESIMIYMSEEMAPNTSKKIPFTFQLPAEMNASHYYFETKVCFGDGKKCTGQDPIRVSEPAFL